MPVSGLNPVQTAFFTAIGGISGLGASVYDYVPQNTAYPYVRIGLDDLTAFDTKPVAGRFCALQVHVFAKAAGSKNAKEIAQKIYAALHRKPSALSVTGFNVIDCVCNFERNAVESSYDGGDKYQHITALYQVKIMDS